MILQTPFITYLLSLLVIFYFNEAMRNTYSVRKQKQQKMHLDINSAPVFAGCFVRITVHDFK